ncbi:RNA polymerase subunit sigma-54 [Vreelandella aquamarina]|jgi:TyrR family helix-turn-helix protein/PAS domain S-box-containing protein|uniref:HTH-type transcriptional regulatory protein TyrR n=1 Tax=Vreelandella aquamarina TaxID=77097 RepID=A0A1N6CXU1_9GAMM|nr:MULTISPECIES: sigma 54-interacting transcriptional regulator [Oceanospirillales]KTG25343.1 histidine kinase [Idiomarina sp. H105]MEE3268043.1 sigma 54-interacting transcriptional regulator [Pseudomonadota bacterium]OAE95279.1 histidine kinase [Idiomarina sp. WRN-38]MBU86025.1 histidine kinase [Alcanivorax sp.]MCD1651023.1 sigma 54-interacting transcriptional regulator [Halomonas axialensis]|tara:strand:- start:992 stop:2410 length:1419 start_codon:yes stop_codon:yes gene_type:complete
MSDIDRRVLQTIIETANDHFFIVSGDGQILDISPGAEAVYGVSREELLSSSVQQLQAAGVLKPSITMEVMRTRQPAQLMQITGTGRRVIAEAYPVFVNGTLERIISRSRDLTDLQLLQDEYALLQKRFSEHLKRSQAAPDAEEQALDDALDNLQVRSHVMREIALLLKRVAPSDANVLMLGESGVGKTAFAKQLHRWSQRCDGPFIEVNCAAIPENLFESEMFGYQPGAFSGAARQGKAGLLEQAEGGTLFLDEIGELPLLMQTKLLKVIQDGSLTRLGDTRSRRVDFRLVVATNQDLGKQVEAGLFRLDLYYRLNVIPVTLPPLRERREDIPDLVEACLQRLNQRYGRQKILGNQVWSTLMGSDWPGNVRELENWLERAWLSSPTDQIEVPATQAYTEQHTHSLANVSASPLAAPLASGESLKEYLERLERDALQTLCHTLPSTYAIAKRLGISQSSVVRRLQRYGIKIIR